MVPVLGKPLVERVMEDLHTNGIDDFILVVSPDDRDILRYFRRESTIQADVRFVYQIERLGMADALRSSGMLGVNFRENLDAALTEADVEPGVREKVWSAWGRIMKSGGEGV